MNAEVTDIIVSDGKIKGAKTKAGDIKCKYIVNAAGLHCDDIAGMVGKAEYKVTPRKGQFFILDKNTSCKVKRIVLPIPTKVTKGKLMCPTIHGNMLVGPTAEDLLDKDDKSTNVEGLDSISADVRKLIPGVRLNDTITQYAGLRAQRNPEGLHVDIYEDICGYVNLSGIRSTGLTASASLGVYVTQVLLHMGMTGAFKTDFDPIRKGIPCLHACTPKERDALIAENPLYGRVICRCEGITEGEIVDAVHSLIPARSIDAVKRRLRAGMGRCHGGFCRPKVIEIIARELNIPAEEVLKNQPGSYLVTGKAK